MAADKMRRIQNVISHAIACKGAPYHGISNSSRRATILAPSDQLLQEHAEVAEENMGLKNLCALCDLL